MSCFTLTPVLRSEWTRLAEIRHDSFKGANDPIATAAHMFNGVTKEDYVAWNINVLENLTPKPGYRIDIIAARDEDRTIAGWAEWSIPLGPTSRPEPKSDEVKVLEKSIAEVPKGARADIWNEFVAASYAYEQKYMGDRRHWRTSIRYTPGFASCRLNIMLCSVDFAGHRSSISASRSWKALDARWNRSRACGRFSVIRVRISSWREVVSEPGIRTQRNPANYPGKCDSQNVGEGTSSIILTNIECGSDTG
jgi:hypothetical protein